MIRPSIWSMISWLESPASWRNSFAVGCAVHPRRFDVDRFESSPRQLVAAACFLQGAGDAANPEFQAATNVRRDVVSPDDHVEHGNRPPGFNTLNASAITRSLSAERLMTQFIGALLDL
jgi:hypothetical protein